MRPVRIIAVVVFAILTLLTAPAWARSEPVRLQVSPKSVTAGDSVTLSGAVGPEAAASECPGGVQLLSRAFGSTQEFAGVPSIGAVVRPNGTFTTSTIIPGSRAARTYPITGRCGGGNFGGATLVVRAATPTPPTALRVSPSSVTAGDRVTVSGSVGPVSAAGMECAGGVGLLSRAFDSTEEFGGVPLVGATVRPDGTFTTSTIIPRSRAAGSYPITGRCGGANFAGAILEVRAAPTTPTTIREPMPPTPPDPPADPPVTQPQPPAPLVAGPATQPTSHLASRWVLPGLAALVSGTLAAVGVWLLYRRRHPAYPSR